MFLYFLYYIIAVAPPTLSPLSPNSLSSVGFIHAFIASISMIIVSEFGDKTFFIAAIMAMRNNRIEVFASAMAALALMTVLSAAMVIFNISITYFHVIQIKFSF